MSVCGAPLCAKFVDLHPGIKEHIIRNLDILLLSYEMIFDRYSAESRYSPRVPHVLEP